MSSSKRTEGKRLIPAALARQDRKAATLSRAQYLAEASDDIALVREKRQTIAGAFYDIGSALIRLQRPAVLKILNCTFEELCRTRLAIGFSTALQLVEIVTLIKRRDAIEWGRDKSSAIVSLARAAHPHESAVAVDVTELARIMPQGTTLRDASAATVKAVARSIRHGHQSRSVTTRPRGRTTTPSERALATEVERKIHAAGFRHVQVGVKATKPGQPSVLEVRAVPIDDAAKVFDLVAESIRRKKK